MSCGTCAINTEKEGKRVLGVPAGGSVSVSVQHCSRCGGFLTREGTCNKCGGQANEYEPEEGDDWKRQAIAQDIAGMIRAFDSDVEIVGADEEMLGIVEEALADEGDLDEWEARMGPRLDLALYAAALKRGNEYAERKDYDRAASHYIAALEAARTLGPQRIRTIGLVAGYTSLEAGDPQQALKCFQEAWENMEDIRDTVSAALVLNGMGLAYTRSGQPEVALTQFQDALRIAREMGSEADEAIILENMSQACEAVGDAEQAIECLGQAADRYEAVGRDGDALRARGLIAGIVLSNLIAGRRIAISES